MAQEVKLTKQEEIILRGDKAFVREVFETEVGGVDKILRNAQKEDVYQFLPMTFPPMIPDWPVETILGSTPRGNKLLAFTRINYWPMCDSKMYRPTINGELQDYFIYSGNPRDDNGAITPERIQRYWDEAEGLVDNPARVMYIPNNGWKIPEEYTCWLMVQYERGSIQRTPYVFMMDKDHIPKVPHFPNVYGGGDICAGRDFGQSNFEEVHPLQKLRSALKVLHDAPPNNDLRDNFAAETRVMRWDLEGNQITPENFTGFFRTVTDERIMEFSTWMKEKGPVR